MKTTEDASAANFSKLPAAESRIPSWYWNRYVLEELRRKIGAMLKLCQKNSDIHVLELGCGNRAYQTVVEAAGLHYQGADFSDNEHADIKLDCNGRAECPPQTFDVVLSIQVLEHVESPAKHLEEIKRLLKPDGQAIISTHGIWSYHPVPKDYWRWTSAGLKKVLRENGFKPEEFEGIMGLVPGSIQLIQDHIRRRLPTFLVKPFTWVCQKLIASIDRLHSAENKRVNAMIYIASARNAEIYCTLK